MIIYVVTKGSYSDYHICGVALSRDRAEKLVKLYSDWYDEPKIEEYDTEAADADMLDHLVPVYNVDINHHGEYIVQIKEYTDSREPFKPSFKLIQRDFFGRSCEPKFRAFLTAKDAEHAVKIAQDERTKQLARAMGL